MEKIDIEEISRLRNTISTNMKFTANEYKSKSRGLNSRLESIMRQYSEYSDVTSRAREIQRMLSEIEKGANTIEKSSEKITNGLKSVVSLVKAEEQESKAIIKDNTQKIIKVKMNDKDVTTKAIGIGKIKVNTIRPEDAILGYPILNDLKETTITHEVGEENFIWKAIETIFTKENVEKLALMWQNAFIIEEQKRVEELQVLKNRLEESGLEPLTDEEVGFYNQLQSMLGEMGTGLTPEQQRSLMSCLHIKGNVEEIDLKRIGVTGKDLKSMSESITLKYDSEYYNDLKDEKRKNQLGLIADFMNDTLQFFSDHAVALGEATVTTGVEIVQGVYQIGIEPAGRLGEVFIYWNAKNVGLISEETFNEKFNEYCTYAENFTNSLGTALVNVFNIDLEKNTILSPLYEMVTGFKSYITGEMDKDELVDYYKDVIQSALTVVGAAKSAKSLKTKLTSKASTSNIDDIADDIVRSSESALDDIADDVVRSSENTVDDVTKTMQDAAEDVKGVVDDTKVIEDGVVVEGAVKANGITSKDIVFGSDAKTAQKLSSQINSRGWTKQLVETTVDNPYTIRTSVNKATGNSATVFYTEQGSYVIVDDVTKAIVQVSDNIDPLTWAPDMSIVDPYIPK